MKRCGFTFRWLLSILLCVAFAACATIKADNLRNRAFEIADLDNWDKDSEKALEYLLKSLEINPDDTKTLRATGRLYYLKEDYNKSESYLKKALALDDKNGRAWNNLGWVYHKKKQYPEMRDAFQKAIEHRGSHNKDAWDYIGLGLSNYNSQEYDLAENNMRNALSLMNYAKSRQTARYWLGCINYKKNPNEEVHEIFRDYIDNHKKKYIAYKSIGRFLYLNGELNIAEKYLKKAIEIKNEYAEAWNNLGWVYLQKEEYSKMRDAFKNASQYRKDNLYDRIGFAMALYHSGEKGRAEKLFKEINALVKTDEEKRCLSEGWLPLAIDKKDYKLALKLWPEGLKLGMYFTIKNNEAKIHYLPKNHLAKMAGLKIGDTITSINGKIPKDNGILRRLLKTVQYGQTINVKIKRGNQELTKKIILDYEHYARKSGIAKPSFDQGGVEISQAETNLNQSESANALKPSANSPPRIIITSPIADRGIKRNALSTEQKSLKVTGRAIDDDGIHEVLINGAKAVLKENGFFSLDVPIAIGLNTIRVVSRDKLMLASEKSVYVNQQSLDRETVSPKRRLALIIGNAEYTYGGKLANPVNDARAMASALKELHFEVMRDENVTQKDMKKAIDRFGQKLANYDVGLFFYAGHGVQVNGVNYLVPVNANLNSANDVEYDCVNAGRVLAKMEDAGSKTNIVVLDACRENPFERSWSRKTKGNGLAFMSAPSGSLIAYATSPGKTASDGTGKNGLYTEALLKNLPTPNITILEMFQRVRVMVMNKSSNHQTPWESTSLRGNFYFKTQ